MTDVSRIDGWADLERGMVTFHITNFSVESCARLYSVGIRYRFI